MSVTETFNAEGNAPQYFEHILSLIRQINMEMEKSGITPARLSELGRLSGMASAIQASVSPAAGVRAGQNVAASVAETYQQAMQVVMRPDVAPKYRQQVSSAILTDFRKGMEGVTFQESPAAYASRISREAQAAFEKTGVFGMPTGGWGPAIGLHSDINFKKPGFQLNKYLLEEEQRQADAMAAYNRQVGQFQFDLFKRGMEPTQMIPRSRLPQAPPLYPTMQIPAMANLPVGGNLNMPFVNWGQQGGILSRLGLNLTSFRGALSLGFAGMPLFTGAEMMMQNQVQATISGRRDRIQDAAASGQVIGSLAGFALPLLAMGGAGLLPASFAAGFGGTIGSGLAQMAAAPEEARVRAWQSVMPAVNLREAAYRNAGINFTWGRYVNQGPEGGGTQGWAQFSGSRAHLEYLRYGWAEGLLGRINGPGGAAFGLPSQMQPTANDILNTYNTNVSSLISGGINPFAIAGNTPGGLSFANSSSFRNMPNFQGGPFYSTASRGGSLIDRLVNVAIGGTLDIEAIRRAGRGTITTYSNRADIEDIGQMYTRRMIERYREAAPKMAESLAPIFGATPDLGGTGPGNPGNIADMLERFGPEATFRRLQLEVELNQPEAIDLNTLIGVSGNIRRARRAGRMTMGLVRGQGVAAMGAALNEMDIVSSLPGGTESESFMGAQRRMRAARSQMFQEMDITNFAIPMSNLEANADIMRVMPFGPGNIFSNELNRIRLARSQMSELRSRFNTLQGAGELSEADELQMTEQFNRLRVLEAMGIATIAEGGENRLPGVRSGTPRSFSRYTSRGLAAFNLGLIGSPIRAYGAATAQQAAEQDSLFSEIGGPISQTAGFNSGRESVNILRQIERHLARMSNEGGLGTKSSGSQSDYPVEGQIGMSGASRPNY